MSRLLLSLSLLVALALPATASGERVVTRKGEAVEGRARFEKDEVIVEKADGTVVRLKKSEVERIELTEEERAAPDVPPAAVEPPPDVVEPPPEQPEEDDYRPTYRPRRPPPPPAYPPPPPFRPRPGAPRLRGADVERSYDQSGGALTLGYHRGLSLGGEWQYRPGKRSQLGFGLGGQLGVESTPDVAYLTYGATGRFYLGREHRFVSEVGYGLNLIDPYLGTDCGADPVCPEKSHGPEVSLGYQFVSRNGLILEILGGIAVATNQALIDEHGQVAPTFQLSMGYLFH